MTTALDTTPASEYTAMLPEWAKEFLAPNRYKIAYGGRMGGRDNTFLRMAAIRCMETPGTQVSVYAPSSETSDHLAIESVISHFRAILRQMRLSDHVHYNSVFNRMNFRNGSRVDFRLFGKYGDDPNEFRGLVEQVDIAVVFESQRMLASSFATLLPSVRKQDSELWFTLNPTYGDDPVYKYFVAAPPRDALIRQVLWKDNPFLPAESNAERIRMKHEEPERYGHVWEGELLADERPRGGTGSMPSAEPEKQELSFEEVTQIAVDWFRDVVEERSGSRAFLSTLRFDGARRYALTDPLHWRVIVSLVDEDDSRGYYAINIDVAGNPVDFYPTQRGPV